MFVRRLRSLRGARSSSALASAFVRLVSSFLFVVALFACDDSKSSEAVAPTASPPPASAPPPIAAAPVVADWCGGHGLPESKCTKCNPELTEKFKAAGDWCEEHGYPESACPSCNPQPPPGGKTEVVDWCIEHGVPESKCPRCNPSLRAGFEASGDWCREHGYPESVCPTCNPQPPPEGMGPFAPGSKVRFKSAELEKAAGIETIVALRPIEGERLRVPARIEYDQNRLAEIRAVVPGIVRRVHVDLGDRVKAGAPLFDIDSTRVADLQAAHFSARARRQTAAASLKRAKTLLAQEIGSVRQVEQAEQELAAARAAERSSAAGLRMAGQAGGASGRFTIVAPLAGVVVERPAVVGFSADEGASLATITDTSRVWAVLDLPESEVNRVALGQKSQIEVDGASPVEGVVTAIASEVDRRTRTVEVRVELANPDGRLRAHQFGRAVLRGDIPKGAVSVPRDAVQRVNEASVVFVRIEAGLYEPRVVEPISISSRKVLVKGPVAMGEAVVTTGAFLLTTELLPGSIGAGCCEVEPVGG